MMNRTADAVVIGGDGAYVAVTHSGATLGPLLGRLIAEEITTGVMPRELEPYRLACFDSHAAQ